MTDAQITIRRADAADFDRIETLLEANGLPYRDVRTGPGRFLVAVPDAAVVGVVGVEQYGSSGLLRSLAVAESSRGRGYGTALCDALEERARTDGVGALYLLTTTAPAFFRRRGYESVAREAAPEAVLQTTEFAELCPASAECMKKNLR